MMKKLPALLCALLLALPLLLRIPDGASRAETPQYAIITLTSSYGYKPTLTVEDAAFLRWLEALLTIDSPAEPMPYHPADDVYEIILCGSEMRTYIVTHDDLYNRATVARPDGTVHSISVNVPAMLGQGLYEQVSFSIPEAHRRLLQQHGWTIAFRHPHLPVMLPRKLEVSRTDPAALHFTWADLFLQDAGYDVSPYLGKAVIPYVYTLYETMPRAAFYSDDTSDVRCSMYAVVLEYNGQIVGAYLKACSLDGANLMSLRGNAAPPLLDGQSIRNYLLARLPMTAQERELAALSPEEVLMRYGEVNDPMLTDVRVLMMALGTGNSQLFSPLALMSIPKGQAVTVTEKRWEDDMTTYEIELPQGRYFPQLVYESAETGWKVSSFYNTGM